MVIRCFGKAVPNGNTETLVCREFTSITDEIVAHGAKVLAVNRTKFVTGGRKSLVNHSGWCRVKT